NPLISAFHIQTDKKIGNFPLIDLFLNARIQRTRIYLKAEHFNSKLTGNNFYSSPSYPYRDFIIRFGLVWNFFN
ncbi:MAG: putative porin, partial [Flavobacteriaceae bacterium]